LGHYLGYPISTGGHIKIKPTCGILALRREAAVPFRLDYISCVLTIASTLLLGKRYWEGWILAAINSAVVCVIGFRTAQFGFIPANVFCIALYAVNLRSWRKPEPH
jgi:nicotinamide riboside transporter PnuC